MTSRSRAPRRTSSRTSANGPRCKKLPPSPIDVPSGIERASSASETTLLGTCGRLADHPAKNVALLNAAVLALQRLDNPIEHTADTNFTGEADYSDDRPGRDERAITFLVIGIGKDDFNLSPAVGRQFRVDEPSLEPAVA